MTRLAAVLACATTAFVFGAAGAAAQERTLDERACFRRSLARRCAAETGSRAATSRETRDHAMLPMLIGSKACR